MHADLQRLLADDLLTDFGEASMELLRQLRIDLTQSEGDVSLVRRISQGRLDIVGHEVGRRGRSEPGDPEPMVGDPSDLLFDMPNILTDSPTGGPRSAGAGRLNPVSAPGPVAISLLESLDGIASPQQLSTVVDLDSDDLARLFDGLREFEIELSSIRRQLHNRIDTIQGEIARRYRDGEASVDTLLR